MMLISLLLIGLSVSELKEQHEREIGVSVSDKIEGHISNKAFEACIPRESIPYPKVWGEDLQKKVFAGDALDDWMDCSPKKCAFNFAPKELESLKNLQSKDEYKKKFIDLYNDRVNFKVGLDPERTPFFFRSFKQPFDYCQSKKFDELLDQRPLRNHPFRLSHVRYSKKMRQTTRLLQGITYSEGPNAICYGEALIFSDHYDLDRVEMWKLERQMGAKPTTEIEVSVRHRIDLLSTWFRRLNKKTLRDELKSVLKAQVEEAANCLKNTPSN